MRPSDNLSKITSNWSNQGKRYDGPVRDTSNYIKIAFTDAKGFRATALVPPEQADAKFQSLLEREAKPIRLQ